jgi:hypothetical protein
VRNVSFTIHTRARVGLGSSGATLRAGGRALQLRTTSTADPTARQTRNDSVQPYVYCSLFLLSLTNPNSSQGERPKQFIEQLSCGAWRADAVRLPTDQRPAALRFPVRGAVKVWVTCGVPASTDRAGSRAADSFAVTTSLCEV